MYAFNCREEDNARSIRLWQFVLIVILGLLPTIACSDSNPTGPSNPTPTPATTPAAAADSMTGLIDGVPFTATQFSCSRLAAGNPLVVSAAESNSQNARQINFSVLDPRVLTVTFPPLDQRSPWFQLMLNGVGYFADGASGTSGSLTLTTVPPFVIHQTGLFVGSFSFTGKDTLVTTKSASGTFKLNCLATD